MVMWLVLLMTILGAIFLVWRAITITPTDINNYRRYEAWKKKQRLMRTYEKNIIDLEEMMLFNCTDCAGNDGEEEKVDDENKN